MSAMEQILGDEERLERLAADIITHYTASCDNKPGVVQKAMVVCSKREIGYALLQKFRKLHPEWFEERKAPEGYVVPEKEMKELIPMPTIAMVATRGKNDKKICTTILVTRSAPRHLKMPLNRNTQTSVSS